jgi:hypothetical protein
MLRLHTWYPHAVFFCIDGPMSNTDVTNPDDGKPEITIDVMRSYIQQSVIQFKQQTGAASYQFSLTPLDTAIAYGAEEHPNIYQHTLNAAELTAFIQSTLGW